MFGVLLSYWYHFYPEALDAVMKRLGPAALSVIGILMLTPAFVFPLLEGRFIHTFGLTLNYLGGGAILLSALAWEKRRPRTPGVFAYVGYHSYSIYLWHLAVWEWGLPFLQLYVGLPRGKVITLAVFAMASCTVGIVMAKVVEMPVLKLRDRLLPSRSGSLVVAVPREPSVVSSGDGRHVSRGLPCQYQL
jgi:peptidoglycan/LPS O-acetylase OafA/YrhL